jgi:hypothetical protein
MRTTIAAYNFSYSKTNEAIKKIAILTNKFFDVAISSFSSEC